MPVNKRGGNKTKKLKKNHGRYEAVLKVDEGQMFGKIEQNNGEHFVILCSDNVRRIAHMTNTIRKGPRLLKDSYVAVSLRDFETNRKTCDIIGPANPPNNILKLFKTNDPKGVTNIEFYDSEDDEDELIMNKNKAQENKNQEDVMNLPPEDKEDDEEFDDFYGNEDSKDEHMVVKNTVQDEDELDDLLGILPSKKSKKISNINSGKSVAMSTPLTTTNNFSDSNNSNDSDDDLMLIRPNSKINSKSGLQTNSKVSANTKISSNTKAPSKKSLIDKIMDDDSGEESDEDLDDL